MTTRLSSVRLLVLGAPDRGDDALALLAVASLPRDFWPSIDVRIRGSLDVVDLADVPVRQGCLVLDAARGLPPGAIRFIPFQAFLDDHHRAIPEPSSSHELPAREVVRLAAVVRGSLPRGGFLVAGGSSFGLGELPSREVALAIPMLVEEIQAVVERLRVAPRQRPLHVARGRPGPTCVSR